MGRKKLRTDGSEKTLDSFKGGDEDENPEEEETGESNGED